MPQASPWERKIFEVDFLQHRGVCEGGRGIRFKSIEKLLLVSSVVLRFPVDMKNRRRCGYLCSECFFGLFCRWPEE